ncbi:hypothetical protein C9374_003122 [Naegleria lovaniensis]|uniref:HD/PDEase domain-containing protein n=1 Tax=Naegleria lovaniensis TaxID=51637 RepID=A0AA88KKP1_NAELO|nr:uncharacterized protein C9374_003122 [Naegleria lovaniensis]KAG2385973.1 hypothetical protein C9374_003122 [Naegleria lovaniensis]
MTTQCVDGEVFLSMTTTSDWMSLFIYHYSSQHVGGNLNEYELTKLYDQTFHRHPTMPNMEQVNALKNIVIVHALMMPNTPTRTSSSHRIEEEEQIHSPRSPITPLSSLSHHHHSIDTQSSLNNEESSSPALTPTSFRKYESSPFSKATTTTSSGSHTMAMMDVSVENKITPPSIKTPPSLFEVSTHSVQKIGQPHPFISPSESVYADRLRYHQHVSSSSHQTLSPFQRRERIFKDEIHSHISFPTSICKQVIDTESFQRLRDLKQLGSCYYVFPGASHNRFEHCLGVGHLSKKWIDKLFMNRQDYYWGVSGHGSMSGGGVGGNGGGHGSMGGGGSGTFSTPNRDGSSDHERPTYKDIYILQVAALCHDLGHGPFSHVFDNEFIPRVKKQNSIMDSIPWTHEMGSKTMFKYMLDENTNDVKNYGDLNENTVLGLNAEEVEHLSEQFIGVPSSSSQQASSSQDMALPTTTLSYDHDIQFIDFGKEECDMVFNMIDGHISKNEFSQNRQYLYQIVANKKNSVDVDKFDYLARDCQNLGLISSYDSSRLMEFSRIIHGNICFSSKEVYNLYEMFHTRYNLHKQVYTHRVGKSVEYMITDALVEADPHLHISEMIHCPEQYVHLSDSILYKIETSTNPELSKSRQILKRLKRRDLYKFVDEVLLPLDRFEEIKKDVCEEEIASCAPNIAGYGHLETCLHPSDIIIHNMSINYSMKDKNPVDQCLFYKSTFGSDDDEPFHIAKEQVSYLIPSQFMERYVRLFVRDANKLDIAYAAFQNWIQKKKLKKSSNSLE